MVHDERHLVDHAPGPLLAGLDGAQHRMRRFARVRAGVTIRRGVAAADLAALLAHAEMHPAVAGLQALLAAGDVLRRVHEVDVVLVGAARHGPDATRPLDVPRAPELACAVARWSDHR